MKQIEELYRKIIAILVEMYKKARNNSTRLGCFNKLLEITGFPKLGRKAYYHGLSKEKREKILDYFENLSNTFTYSYTEAEWKEALPREVRFIVNKLKEPI